MIQEMASLNVHDAHPHDHSTPIARIGPKIMESIGAAEGDILEIIGSRRAVAKCMPLGEKEATSNPNTIWLTNTVRNNAEVPLNALVEVKKKTAVEEARRITIVPAHSTKLTENLPHLGITQHLPAMFSGSPVLVGDYIVALQPMGGSWIVFQVLAAEGDKSVDNDTALVITKRTAIEVKGTNEINAGEAPANRGYPVFWVSVRDGVRKNDADVLLIMTFYGLHYEGMYSGEFEIKITKETDIQRLVTTYRETAIKEVDVINEEAKNKQISADNVKTRILQKWISV